MTEAGIPTDSSPFISSSDDIPLKTIQLAEQLLYQALQERNFHEKSRMEKISRLIEDPSTKQFSMLMTDRLIRSHEPKKAAAFWRRLIQTHGIPRGLSLRDQILLLLGYLASFLLPQFVMEAIQKQLRQESHDVILKAEAHPLHSYLESRKQQGWRVNVNLLGEAILGEEEASHRIESILQLLSNPEIHYVSIKISAIFSQINLVAWESTLEEIKNRLRRLYRAGLSHQKFINLDMEEYRDLALTEKAFRDVLDEPEFLTYSAGIVLQAYLPDSWTVLQTLTTWALQRVERGGSPIKIRIVKGANLAMEQVEAELHHWFQAPYSTKSETDSNFKRMLDFMCDPLKTRAVKIGVGSHNLFDIALALVLKKERGIEGSLEIEMLEGMANHQARVVQKESGTLLIYSPMVHEENFGSALAYLIRRLDENTAEENFLRHLFHLSPQSPEWNEQKERFFHAWNKRFSLTELSRRSHLPPTHSTNFTNIADTDWTQLISRQKLHANLPSLDLPPLPSLLGLEELLQNATQSQPLWENQNELSRAAILHRCAQAIADHRFDLIALLQYEGKKAVSEADGEISEAIDFANYYATTGNLDSTVIRQARGIVLVAPPWNFPLAIPCSGIFAALMAGNAVILKPAPETVQIAWKLVRLLWGCGIPREVLQFYPCPDEQGKQLIMDKRISTVVLTGSYQTAKLFQSWRPSLALYAETSGKNSIIITALADRDLAIKDLVRSAFGHSGQKCSAASLGILEAEVYDDPSFRRQLRDAAMSLSVGSAKDLKSIITPLIQSPGKLLLKALTTLEPGESWLLEPQVDPHDPSLWSPGIKLGVQPHSWFHQTECFGPVLGLMRASNLNQAIHYQNEVPYGLTAGIHSLDEKEIQTWKKKIEAGNLYINRPITGAIVQRQPFGGWKRSSVGPGSKAGGPHYVNLFRHLSNIHSMNLDQIKESYRNAWENYFQHDHDPSHLKCESNILRYRPARGVILRLHEINPEAEALAHTAAELCQVPLKISRAWEECDAQFIPQIPFFSKNFEFLRTVETPSDLLLRALAQADLHWIQSPFNTTGELELTHWLREQSVSETSHRYGNLLRFQKR